MGNKTGQHHGPDHFKNLLRAEGNKGLAAETANFGQCRSRLQGCVWNRPFHAHWRLHNQTLLIPRRGYLVAVFTMFTRFPVTRFLLKKYRVVPWSLGVSSPGSSGGRREHTTRSTLTSVWEWRAFFMVLIPDARTDLGLQPLSSAASAGHLYKWKVQHSDCANTRGLCAW